MAEIVLGGVRIAPGSRDVVTFPVTNDLGFDVNLAVHVAAGRHEGPTLLLLSMLHGNEWFSVLILREFLARLDLNALAGNVLAVPVANPTAFLSGSRCVQDDSDEPDANRSFGGRYLWTTNQITNVIVRELMSRSHFLVDYHVGDWGCTMADIGYGSDYPDPALSAKSRGMALAYGFPVVHAMELAKPGTHSPRTSMGYAATSFGIPGIVPEVGGLGFGEEIERKWLDQNIRGLDGTMRYLGMVPGLPDYCDRYLFVKKYRRVHPRCGGYLETFVGLDRQCSAVREGELLGRIVSPTTFDVLEELRAPCDGVLFYTCRSYMVRPGGWAFGIADTERGESFWEAV